MKKLYLLLLLIFFVSFASNGKARVAKIHKSTTLVFVGNSMPEAYASVLNDTSVHAHRKHKLIAALLAMPLGVLGLHRIYLGTASGVPFLYIASFGGAIGILPFVDFVLIILCKDVNTYANNPRVFMWSKKK